MLWHAPCNGAVVRADKLLVTWDVGDDDTCEKMTDWLRVLTNMLSGVLVIFVLYLTGSAIRRSLASIQKVDALLVEPNCDVVLLPSLWRTMHFVPAASKGGGGRETQMRLGRRKAVRRLPHVMFVVLTILALRTSMHAAAIQTTPWTLLAAFAFGVHMQSRWLPAAYAVPFCLGAAACAYVLGGCDGGVFPGDQRQRCETERYVHGIALAMTATSSAAAIALPISARTSN